MTVQPEKTCKDHIEINGMELRDFLLSLVTVDNSNQKKSAE